MGLRRIPIYLLSTIVHDLKPKLASKKEMKTELMTLVELVRTLLPRVHDYLLLVLFIRRHPMDPSIAFVRDVQIP